MTENLIARATPTREFFVYMLTRDITLHDCILELIDNCLDGARRTLGSTIADDPTDNAFSGFGCSIRMSKAEFEITDNCGGIPIKLAEHYAFRFGRDPNAPKDKYGVGLYGIGMKRALFKLGRYAEVHSRTSTDAFRVTIDADEWLAARGSDWSFPIALEKKRAGNAGTRIVVNQINPGIDEQLVSRDFESLLLRLVGRDYAFFLERGFSVKINDHAAKPERFELRTGGGFKPARIRYRDETGVNVEIFAGMASAPQDDENPDSRADRSMDLSGWYILCNERTILAADKTERTVWGYAGVPDWHPQYNGFAGFAFFRSRDPEKLPWTTTKRDVDVSSEVYKRALRHLRTLTKTWVAYTNKRKADVAKAKVNERSTKPVRVLDLPTATALLVPKTPALQRTLANILYQKPLPEIDRAREALGDSNLSNREVGERTFDYFFQREVNG